MAEENAEIKENSELENAETPANTSDLKKKVAKPKKESDVSIVLMIGGALGAVVLIIVSSIIGTVVANRIFPPYIIEMPAPPPTVADNTDGNSTEKKKKKKLKSTDEDDDDDDSDADDEGEGTQLLGHNDLYTFKSDKITTNVKGSLQMFGQLIVSVDYKLLFLDELSEKGFIKGYTKPASNVQFDDYDNNYYDDYYNDYYEKFKNNEKNKGKSKNDYKKSNNKSYIRNISYDYNRGIQIVPASYSYNANYYRTNNYDNYNDNNYHNAYNNYNYNNDYFIMNTAEGSGDKKGGSSIEVDSTSKIYTRFKQAVTAKLNEFIATSTSEELQAMRPEFPKILQEFLKPLFKEYGLRIIDVQVVHFLIARN